MFKIFYNNQELLLFLKDFFFFIIFLRIIYILNKNLVLIIKEVRDLKRAISNYSILNINEKDSSIINHNTNESNQKVYLLNKNLLLIIKEIHELKKAISNLNSNEKITSVYEDNSESSSGTYILNKNLLLINKEIRDLKKTISNLNSNKKSSKDNSPVDINFITDINNYFLSIYYSNINTIITYTPDIIEGIIALCTAYYSYEYFYELNLYYRLYK